MPILCSMECARTSLRLPSEPSALTRNFGTTNSEMNNIVGEFVLAVGDENLLPGDAIGAVAGAFRLGAQCANIGTGLRLGELHRAHPFAGNHLRQIDALEFLGAMARECVDAGHGQHRADAECGGSRVPHLDTGDVDGLRQPLSAPLFGRR